MHEPVYQAYQEGWRSVHAAAIATVAESGANLARVLNVLQKPKLPDENAELLKRFGYRILGRRLKGITDCFYEVPLFELQLQQELIRVIDADTVNIVELGSGYGKNLFRIWLNGGPARAEYVGYEYTAGGRECSAFLASLEQRIRFRSLPFDFYTPRCDGFDKNAKTFVFTCYAIEQIPNISPETFDALLEMPGLYKVVHIEPVGWQRKWNHLPLTSEWTLLRSTMRSALACRYNENFLSLIETLEVEGKIVVDEIKYDFLAHRPNLPGSVIIWRPKA